MSQVMSFHGAQARMKARRASGMIAYLSVDREEDAMGVMLPPFPTFMETGDSTALKLAKTKADETPAFNAEPAMSPKTSSLIFIFCLMVKTAAGRPRGFNLYIILKFQSNLGSYS